MNLFFIGSNSDTGSEQIKKSIEKFCKENGCRRFASLKVEEYQSLVKNSMGLVGNSRLGDNRSAYFKSAYCEYRRQTERESQRRNCDRLQM